MTEHNEQQTFKADEIPCQEISDPAVLSKDPVVSVHMITYNHESYIARAIEGVLMQETNFPIELIIGEDCSTDRTREIVLDYQKQYPDIIKGIFRKENVGLIHNFIDTFKYCKGKYIAICEGDDYWTDPYKLQKQVDFLEANPNFSLCFHDAIVLWEDKSQPPKYFCPKDQKETSTIEDVIAKWFIPPASMVLRKEYITPLPEWFSNIYNGDWALHMILANKEKIYYFDELMSVYRKNQGALSGGIGKNVEFVNKQKIKLLNYFNGHSDFKYNNLIAEKIKSLYVSTNAYKLRKKSKILYWLINPLKLANKILIKIKN